MPNQITVRNVCVVLPAETHNARHNANKRGWRSRKAAGEKRLRMTSVSSSFRDGGDACDGTNELSTLLFMAI